MTSYGTGQTKVETRAKKQNEAVMTFETFEGVLFPRQLDLTVAKDQRGLLAESRPDVARKVSPSG